jgi:tetratricopeptide (TPR) repeat protein
MIAPRRLRLHQEVARALEAQYGARREDHAAELAEHFSQSTDRADLAKAVEYGEQAAQRAMSVYAYAEAASHLERCLAVQEVLDPYDKSKRCDLLLALGEALMPAGEPLRVGREIALEAFQLAETLGDASRCSLASQVAMEGFVIYGSGLLWASHEWREWTARADQYAQPESNARVLADIALARREVGSGSRTKASHFLSRAVQLARRKNDPELMYRSYGAAFGMVSASVSWRDEIELQGLAREIVTMTRAGVGSRHLAQALLWGGLRLLEWGDRETAEGLWRELISIADRTQYANVRVLARAPEAITDFLDGRLERAIDRAEEMTSFAREAGSEAAGLLYARNWSTRPFILLGRAPEALQLIRRGEESTASEMQLLINSATRCICLAHLGSQEVGSALDAVRHVMRDQETRSHRVLLPVVEAQTVSGATIDESLLTEAKPAASWLLLDVNMTSAARLLGAAANRLNRPEEARSYYDQALEVCAKVRFRPEIALTRLQLAELLLEHYPDERATAIEHLDFAIAEFRAMKMQPSLERALRHRELLKA